MELTTLGTVLVALAVAVPAILTIILRARLKAAREGLEAMRAERRAEQDAARAQRVGESWAHPRVPGRDIVGVRYMHTYMVACGSPGSYGGTQNFSPQEWESWVAEMGDSEEAGLCKIRRLQRRLCEEYLAEVDSLQAEARCRKAEAAAREAAVEVEAAQHRLACLRDH